MPGPEVHRIEGIHIMGRNYRWVPAGNWKWRLTHTPLEEEQKWGQIYHKPNHGQPTIWKVDHFGWKSCHRVWSRDLRMGGGYQAAGWSRRHTGHRVEPSGHVAEGQGAGWETLKRLANRKCIPGSGDYMWRHREQSHVVPASTAQGTWHHCQENKNLRFVQKMVEWRNEWGEKPAGKWNGEEVRIGGDSPGNARIAEVVWKYKRQDLEWVPVELEVTWGLQSSEVCQPVGRSDCGGPDRQ